MALDVYSACPGGTGKKIKFCCSDFLGELQKIDRMVAGEQYLACLQHIDRLMAREPGRDRPCLMATKGLLLRATGQNDAAGAHAADFLAKHPNNQIALAESAILTVQTDARAALGALQRALRYADGGISPRTYEAMGYVAADLLDEGYWLPGRALLQFQVAIQEQDDQPVEMLLSLNRSTEIPLLLRDDPPVLPCPDGVKWRDRYLSAVETVGRGDWETAARKLTELAADAPDSSVIWRTLATLRGWLTDNDGGIEALRKYAALRFREEGELEDAVEAEATAMLLSPDPLGDQLDVFHATWTVKDVERLQEALLSSPRLQSLPFDPAQFAGGETPPPKAAFIVLDRPAVETSEGLNLDNMPRAAGHAMLFGRQTDREARLEMMNVAADELPAVKALVGELAGDAVEPDTNDEVVRRWSASQKMLSLAMQPPRGTSPEQLRDLLARHFENGLLKQWPDLKLGILDDRTPREAAGDATCRVRLLAAIMVLEHWSERSLHEFDFNRLRGCLGLPVLGPIDPQNRPVAELPLVRLGRLALEGLVDGELVLAYRRAAAFAIRPAMQKFAQAIIERPSLSGKPEQLPAYGTLARTAEDPAKAMQYINQGRLAAERAGHSSASWDLLELSLRFGQREGHDAMRLIEHLQSKHLEEPGVGEALTHMLIEVGLLRPDGTPAFGPDGREPVHAAAAEAAAEPGKLWTPDSAQSGGGKLWTPE
jgi:tetratricopeptide (TPR) repeat protein